MKVKIQTLDDYYILLEACGLPPASTFQKLFTIILNNAKGKGESAVLIKVARHIMQPSYISVPAMFARTMQAKVLFTQVQSYLRGEYLYVYASEVKKPITFRARVISGLKTDGFFETSMENIPVTYQHRPYLLTGYLTSEIGKPICNTCKNGKMKWYVRKPISIPSRSHARSHTHPRRLHT